MILLLDTNVMCEMTKRNPDEKFLPWFDRVVCDHVCVSAFTLGETGRSIQKLREGKRWTDLLLWFDDLLEDFRFLTLPVDSQAALL
ncbi:MAG: PIN domain-containing protein [Sphaerochaetaceae bacterium]|nr:PIN domain-containing protein [Sphaerochaetaceae bacterium]